MVKYVKPRRTEQRGLRPSTFIPPEINPKDIQRMGEMIQGILKDSQVTDQEKNLLRQVHLLSLRRVAIEEKDHKKAQKILEELNDNEDELHEDGFKEYQDIRPLNFWVLEKEKVEGIEVLEELIQQIEGKVPELKQ